MTLSVEHATVGRGGQGQWALGEREPLNPTETFKLEDDALNVRARVEQIYARKGFDSIPDDDLQGRLRWWGLYTQRKQGIDGGKTATLEPHELQDKYFMLRVRIDGGALLTEQLRVIAGISKDELIDPTWAIEEIKRRFIGNPDFSNLPRKFKTALTGMLTNDVVHEINDISIKYYLTAMLFIIFDIE